MRIRKNDNIIFNKKYRNRQLIQPSQSEFENVNNNCNIINNNNNNTINNSINSNNNNNNYSFNNNINNSLNNSLLSPINLASISNVQQKAEVKDQVSSQSPGKGLFIDTPSYDFNITSNNPTLVNNDNNSNDNSNNCSNNNNNKNKTNKNKNKRIREDFENDDNNINNETSQKRIAINKIKK